MLWLKSRNSEVWLERRTNYTRSTAVMSMVRCVQPVMQCAAVAEGHLLHRAWRGLSRACGWLLPPTVQLPLQSPPCTANPALLTLPCLLSNPALPAQVGYILGLGDRHPSNLMLDRYSGAWGLRGGVVAAHGARSQL